MSFTLVESSCFYNIRTCLERAWVPHGFHNWFHEWQIPSREWTDTRLDWAMMHWWASKSNEYCSPDSIVTPSLSCVARSCPGLSGFADLLDTSCVTVLTWPRIPDASFGGGHSPKVSFCARRRRLTNAEHRGFGYKSQLVSWDGGCGTRVGPDI